MRVVDEKNIQSGGVLTHGHLTAVGSQIHAIGISIGPPQHAESVSLRQAIGGDDAEHRRLPHARGSAEERDRIRLPGCVGQFRHGGLLGSGEARTLL
jgi:hypothetical protein